MFFSWVNFISDAINLEIQKNSFYTDSSTIWGMLIVRKYALTKVNEIRYGVFDSCSKLYF